MILLRPTKSSFSIVTTTFKCRVPHNLNIVKNKSDFNQSSTLFLYLRKNISKNFFQEKPLNYVFREYAAKFFEKKKKCTECY